MSRRYRLLSDAVDVTLTREENGTFRGIIAVRTFVMTLIAPELQLGKTACVLLARLLWDERTISKQRPNSLENPTWDDSLFREKKVSERT